MSPAPSNGTAMHALIGELFPICRSITGDGLRQTLARIGREIPLTLHEISTGAEALDWTVPNEWNIRDAYVADLTGRRIIDFRRNNLEVVNYSAPVRARMTLAELRPHLHSIPEHPDWIPYRTSYYQETWGFCLTDRALQALPDAEYDVVIDSTLAPGSLTYGECVLPGTEPDEVLISCHVCHPSLANDNLSGLAVATWLAKVLAAEPRRLTYRFVFAPGTIGAIVWLARNPDAATRVQHGLVVACVGDPGPFCYKESRRGNAVIDQVVRLALKESGVNFQIRPFAPIGYDERQYCSPGFNLPVGSLTRTPNGMYPEYHSSADNLSLVTPEALEASLDMFVSVIDLLEANLTYLNQYPFGEPQLGRRGLYGALGGDPNRGEHEAATLWALNLSDGRNSLLDIVQHSGIPSPTVRLAVDRLVAAGLLARAPE